jgi:hypothetical protein
MIDRLRADGPRPDLADQLDLFGRFVGAWDLEWHGRDLAGAPIVVSGELHVGWILGGAAVQDVWRVPMDPGDSRHMRAFHGTTIRFYDSHIDAWRSTWIDPLNGRVRRFIGRTESGIIILDGLDEDPKERWTFRDVTTDSFLWRGESSTDAGRSWVIEDEMLARRHKAT